MSNNVYYRLYRDEVVNFARTLVIKSQGVADTLNRELTALGITVMESRPETWKYYMNLAGEYHQTDSPMSIRSVDTLEEIAFTKENLRVHRATFREYQFGTRYYKELTKRYPNQVPLINGILSPVDKQTAIDAEDGTLLYYDPTYVEPNETNLIEKIQQWLYQFYARWYNGQYTITDDLFVPGFLGVLYAQLPEVILLARKANAKTPYAHSFHIREYLASNGRLDTYLDYLNKDQQLYLYRNIRFINRNVGKQMIFDRLVKRLLSDRGIPLAWYKLQHNTAPMPEALYADVEMAKYPINFGYNQSGRDTSTVHTILNKERSIARENAVVQEEAEPEIIEQTQSSAYSSLPTKVLESEVVDRSNSSVRSLESVLLYEWLYLSTHQRYNAYINVPNPGTGQYMSMTVRDAFIVALYAFSKVRDFDLDSIPQVVAMDVLRDPLPTRDELNRIVDHRWVPEGMVEAIQDRITPLGSYITTERFYQDCATLHEEYIKLWELYSFQEHPITRGFCEQLVRRHFMNIKCRLIDETISFEQWFKEKGFGVADLSSLDLEQLFVDCVKNATGANLVTRRTLGELQRAMLALMRQLTSYSVQYLRTINQDDFWYVGRPTIRVGDMGGSQQGRARVELSGVNLLQYGASHHHSRALQGMASAPVLDWNMSTRTRISFNPSVRIRKRPSSLGYVKFNVASVGVRSLDITVTRTSPPDPDLGHYQYPDTDSDWPSL